MAFSPERKLVFQDGCGDCGERRVSLPAPLPRIPDDFDWLSRDYDSLRIFMMEELAHRFPDRRRWSAADQEVVIVEALAAALDRLSHVLDVVQNERLLATARRPGSVRRLLAMIGYDAVARAPADMADRLPALPSGLSETAEEGLERFWTLWPNEMEAARADGPRRIGEQARMVTLEDHATWLARHPLCERAAARLVWSGAWSTILISVVCEGARRLDDPLVGLDPRLWAAITEFHRQHGLPPVDAGNTPSARQVLRSLTERYRMAGSEILLEDARQVPVTFALSARAKPGYFRSELKDGLTLVLSAASDGLWRTGRLGFGEDVQASDIIEAAMTVEGVASVCLNRFKRMGARWPDQADSGTISIAAHEIAICENSAAAPELGRFFVTIHGGEIG